MSWSFAEHSEVRNGINRGRVECDIQELEYEGAIPEDLNGVFYRAGSDPQYLSNFPGDSRWNGDGMVSLFRCLSWHVDSQPGPTTCLTVGAGGEMLVEIDTKIRANVDRLAAP